MCTYYISKYGHFRTPALLQIRKIQKHPFGVTGFQYYDQNISYCTPPLRNEHNKKNLSVYYFTNEGKINWPVVKPKTAFINLLLCASIGNMAVLLLHSTNTGYFI